MEKQTQNFLNLVSSFVWDTTADVKDADWKILFHLAKIHNLIPAVYHAAYRLPAFSEASNSVKKQFMESSLYQSGAQYMRTQEFLSVYDEFAENGIHPRVLKGLICRSLYPNPDMRISCDEDLWITREDLPICDRILRSRGYQPDLEDITPLLDTIQEATYSNHTLTLELHMDHPFGTDDSVRLKMNQIFENSYNQTMCVSIQGQRIYTLSPTEHCLFLFTHLYKHFLYGGVGIRQILDLLLFLNRYENEIDFDRINSAVILLEGETFYAAVLEIGRRYLGFSNLKSPGISPDTAPLLEDLIESGCFGNTSRFQRLAATFVAADSIHKNTGKPQILTLLFPSAPRIYHNYPFLVKRPWLVPAAWVMRIFKFVKELLLSDRKLAAKSIRRGKKRTEILKKYKTILRR